MIDSALYRPTIQYVSVMGNKYENKTESLGGGEQNKWLYYITLIVTDNVVSDNGGLLCGSD